ncbi:DoxX family protein [bacterium]|nr:DoxX family protein [bacterium]
MNTQTKTLNLVLWIVQILLALMFGMSGFMKTFMPLAELLKSIPGLEVLPEGLIRFIGISELAGALGLILPALTKIKPVLTPLAGIGFLIIMVLAAGFHMGEGKFDSLPINIILGGLSAFIAWGRWPGTIMSSHSISTKPVSQS